MTIDLTIFFKNAIRIKERGHFNQQNWLAAFRHIYAEHSYIIYDNVEEEKWGSFGLNEINYIYRSDLPLLFISTSASKCAYLFKLYTEDFVSITRDSDDLYSIDLTDIDIISFFKEDADIKIWKSCSINPNSFSFADLFYMTH